jgi:predicted O-linked N-acetylglucosamine transferase (SPINDLY family)
VSTAPPELEELCRGARAAQLAGNLPLAEQLCLRILQRQANRADALHLLGVILIQTGRIQAGMESVRRSLEADPMQPAAYCALGNALRILNRPEEALAEYQHALDLDPRNVPALNNRGSAFADLGRPLEALESYESALRLKPDHPGALVNHGRALLLLGRPADALASFERALQLRGTFAAALAARGTALFALRRLDEALASLDECLALSPNDPQLHHDRGDVLLELWRPAEASGSYERALELDPTRSLTRFKCSVAHVQLGSHAAAAASFARLLEIAPDYPFALGGLLWSRLMQCDWIDWAQITERALTGVAGGRATIIPFALLAVCGSPATQLQCAQAYASAYYPAAPDPLWRAAPYRHRKIRIAYLSADFGSHPVSALLVRILELHDRQRFETVALSLQPAEPTPFGKRVGAACDTFVDASRMNDREVAAAVRAREVDILVDLMGYTTGSRTAILAHRPAPVQVNYLGFPGTMGAPFIDYILADEFAIPVANRADYAEKVVWLPGSFQANDDLREVPGHRPTRGELSLPREAFVFCCFNNTYKINPACFDVWMRLLRTAEPSVLWIYAKDPVTQGNLRREAAQRGVDPARLIFAPRLPYREHLARLASADLFLDTFPFNAGTSASDALWTGLPVLTLAGEAMAARYAGSLLRAVGLPELVTRNADEYETTARHLARSPALLADLRARLTRDRPTLPLFDSARFCRHLEEAFHGMWQRSERGEAPASFAVGTTRPGPV